MKLDSSKTIIERWKMLDNLTKGKRYLFHMTDGDLYEAEYRCAYNGEPDVDVSVRNVRDLSENPRFDGVERFGFSITELAEVTPV